MASFMKNTTPNRVGGDSCCMRLSDEFLNSSNTAAATRHPAAHSAIWARNCHKKALV